MNWNEALVDLADQVTRWISGDLAKRGHMVLHVLNMVPTAEEPLLEIEVSGSKVLRLEPAAHAEGQVPTVVNLYAYPTLRRVLLTGPREDGSWNIVSSDGVEMRFAWSEKDFVELVKILAEPNVARRI